MTFVDVQLIDGLGLPYIVGAEAGLLDPNLDPIFNDAWQAFVATFPGQTLLPRFDELPIEELADLVDSVRVSGDEPPDPFVWFTLSCDNSQVDAIVPALLGLPMVLFAAQRPIPVLAESISYGTNPDANIALQIQPSPHGVDAIYAWQIPGGAGDRVRIVDIEFGWRLDHEELLTARITRRSVFGTPTADEIDHGTAVAGIIVGADNGVGMVGIVPNADLDLVTVTRANGDGNLASAISWAARHLTLGDILLLEVGCNFFARPNPNDVRGDILAEFDPAVQLQIRLAVRRGITVIEPAGNGGVNLDQFPFLAHTRPGSPTFSGAVVVGAGDLNFATNTWSRASFSSFGSRVDCFASGTNVRAPSSTSTNTYQQFPQFRGTSGASAIIAGVAASLQAMTWAASKGTKLLAPADLRWLLRSASLGTLPVNPLGAKIGAMPDLREITRAKGLARILPVGAAFIGLDALLIVHLDADNHMVRRHFTFLSGWGEPIPSPSLVASRSPGDSFELTAAQPAVASTDETNPDRLVFDAFFSGPGGLHHMFWDSLNLAGDVSKPIVGTASVAQGRAIGAVRARVDLQVLAAINPQGRLLVITGDPQNLLSTTSAPAIIDPVGNYRRVAGPTIMSRAVGLVDLVAIEDGGSLNWFTGALPAAAGTGFSGPITIPSVVTFDPGARPALLSTGNRLLAAAVGTDGVLRATTIDPALLTMDAPVQIDPAVTIATSGPVALARLAVSVVALAVDTQGTLRVATRLVAGGNWTPLIPVLSPVTISPLGGVTAVSMDFGVMAIAVSKDGVVCSAMSVDGLIWTPLTPLP